MTSQKPLSPGELFRRWWFLILAIIGIIAESAIATHRISQIEKELTEQRDYRVQLIRIEERQKTIKNDQDEIKHDIKTILEKIGR